MVVPGARIGPNVCLFNSVGWPGRLEFMAEAPIAGALGRQSALAEAYGLYRMIQAECRIGACAHRRLAECFQLDGVQEYTQLFDSIGLRCTDSISELHASLT